MSGTYSFLPWVRQGIATAIRAVDTLGPGVAGHASLPVTLRVNDRQDAEVSSEVRLYGPGNIVGIDRLQIIRTDPQSFTTGFEPNYFPAIEFDRPDFPWLFTPAAANQQGKFRPWLCLIAVEIRDGVSIESVPGQPLPTITVTKGELPNLSESWAWAHTQVVSSGDSASSDTLEALLAENSQQTISRLLCPRRLEPNTRYYACLVPAFEAGRKAGLGQQLTADDEAELAPAWPSDGESPVTLPVYYHWEFGTGVGGDFESLLRLLEWRPLPSGVGARDMEVADLGPLIPDAGVLGLEGALRPPGARPVDEVPDGFEDGLRSILNRAASPQDGSGPLVAPPIYGSWHATQHTVPAGEDPPNWLRILNLDPRHRAAAGFGTLVVQDNQEQLMASAWEQVGQISPANQALRQAQFARETERAVHEKRLANMTAEMLFRVTGPVHARVRTSRQTLYERVRQSCLPEAADSAAFRRILRPRGSAGRQTLASGEGRARPVVEQLASGELVVAPSRPPPSGVASPQNALTELEDGEIREVLEEESGAVAGPEQSAAFQGAAQQHQAYFERALSIGEPGPKPALQIADVGQSLLERLDPDKTVPERVSARLGSREDLGQIEPDPVGEIMVPPRFPQPMYEALRDLSQDLLLPGLEHVPPNTVTLLETNPPFVEAYMVGLNHEMGRELLWREYPTDQRGTYFGSFWASRGAAARREGELAEAEQALRLLLDLDLRLELAGQDTSHLQSLIEDTVQRVRELEANGTPKPIHKWDPENSLGENSLAGGAEDRLVLLLRGELLRRYPTAVVYAVEAKRSEDGTRRELGDKELHPLFQGTMKPDITFLGFDLTEEEARGTTDPADPPGWFFVIQQQPTEPRFGLDEATGFGGDPGELGDWNELSWGHLVPDEPSFQTLSYVSVVGRLAGLRLDSAEWGLNAAHMAYITLQRPVRIAVHADDVLPAVPDEDE